MSFFFFPVFQYDCCTVFLLRSPDVITNYFHSLIQICLLFSPGERGREGEGRGRGGELIGRSISNWTPYYFNAIILSTVSHVYINFYLSVCLSLCFFHLSLVPAFLDHFSSSSAIVLFCWVSFYFTFLGFQWKERGRTKERKKKREREMDRRKERQKRRKGGKRKEAPVLICSRGICFRGLTSSD